MKKIFFFIVVLLTLFYNTILTAQNFSGVAVYIARENWKGKFFVPGMNEDDHKKLEQKMAKDSEKNCELRFDKTTSVFEEKEKLNVSTSKNGVSVQKSSASKGLYYKDLKLKKFIKEEDLFDKPFLIQDDLEVFNWQIATETKKIGSYNCRKATVVFPVTKEDNNAYNEKLKQIKKLQSDWVVEKPKPIVYTAWFTTEIPISNGPGKYWGLPGLILELYDGEVFYLCTKITLNPTEKVKIIAPVKGKKVSQKQFDLIAEEKYESMKNKNGSLEINVRE